MDIMELRKVNLRKLVTEKGGTAKFSTLVGRKPSLISQIIGRKARVGLGEARAREFERILSLPKYWLDQSHQEPALYTSQGEIIAPAEYIWFPFIDIAASLTANTVAFSEEKGIRWPIDITSLKSIGAQPDSGCFLKVEDEGVTGISKDDVVFIDRSKADIRSGHIYAVKLGNEILVRRLFKNFDNTLKIVCDNPAEKLRFPDLILPIDVLGANLLIIGEVLANMIAKLK